MSTVIEGRTEWRLESPVASTPGVDLQSDLQSDPVGKHALTTTAALPSTTRTEESTMYSPISIAFFGMTGTAVGAAGVTGSFGGLTSVMVTLAVLLLMFCSLLIARSVARRRVGR